MGARARSVALVVGVGLLMLALAAPAPASTADIIAPTDPANPQVDSGWQAGTCKEEPPESTEFCSVDTPDQFFKRAAAHPNWGFTQFIVAHTTEEPVPPLKLEKPVGELKTVRVDLPVGLSVNPGATPRCQLETFEADPADCPAGSEVGESQVTASLLGVVAPPASPLTAARSVYLARGFRLVAEDAEPHREFGVPMTGQVYERELEASPAEPLRAP